VTIASPAVPAVTAPRVAPEPRQTPLAVTPDLSGKLAELERNLEQMSASAKTEAERNAALQRELAAANDRLRGLETELRVAQARPIEPARPTADPESATLRKELSRKDAEVARYSREVDGLRGVVRVLQSASLRQVELTPSDPAAGKASARALVAADGGLLLLARRLPVLPAGKCYQLWILRKSGPAIVSGGLIATDGAGGGILVAPPSQSLSLATGFAITDEPAGGSTVAKGHKLLFGAS